MTSSEQTASPSAKPLPPNVKALAAVSLLSDVASEMIYPLLPGFLTGVLGAGAATIGAIEGAAEATASFLKLASGWGSDRMARRKPLVVAGYLIAAIARPLVAIAGTAAHVMAIRVSDRVGKGIRTSPRDALLADSVDPAVRGRAFGFHRAADNFGAVLGPLLAFALMGWFGMPIRDVFWCAAIPGLIGVVVLMMFVKEVPRRPHASAASQAAPSQAAGAAVTEPLPGAFRRYLFVLFLFTLGNCTDAFLLLRAAELGVPAAQIPLLWAALHLVKSVSSTPGGALSDRVGRRPLLVVGWIWFAVVYAGLGAASATWHVWALFLAYGVFFGLTEGTEKALVADLAPASRRGAAFGWFNAVVGIGTLPASALFGVVWDAWGSSAAFALGGAFGLAAAVLFVVLVPERPRAAA